MLILRCVPVMTLAAAVLPKSTETPLEDYLNKMVPQTGGYNINAGAFAELRDTFLSEHGK